MDNFIITNTEPNVILTIATKEITENWTKALISIAYPKSEGQQDKETPSNNYEMKILDILGKMERRVTVIGHLVTGLGATDTSTNAQDKAEDLRKLFQKGGLMNISYYAGNFDGVSNENKGIMDKMEIKKISNDTNDNTSNIIEFDVNLSFLIGTNMTGG